MNAEELKQNLKQFTGTENVYNHALNQSLSYTDGVRFFARNAGGGAYWFLDIVATEYKPLTKTHDFLSIALSVDEKSVGRITVTDGNDNVIAKKYIDYTDCPTGKWQFFLTNNVLLLTSEY